jgi:4-hydroxy-3-polyprenylbenzoate decarboxylase
MTSKVTNLPQRPVIIGITGASGAALGQRAVDLLLSMNVPVILICSNAGRVVWNAEMEESFGAALERWSSWPIFTHYHIGDITAPIASGTFSTTGMLIIPCSAGTLAAISHGLSDNLIRRAADVTLKENRRLVLVVRETPLSVIHLENMLSLARLGVTIMPPEPAYYLRPTTIIEANDFIASRAVESLGLTEALPDQLRYKGPK